MEKALEKNKTLENLILIHELVETLPREFCRNIVSGLRQNSSLSKLELNFSPESWDCPDDGRLVYASHMLCDAMGCSVLCVASTS